MSFMAFWIGNQAERRSKKYVGGILAFLPQGMYQAKMGGN